MSLDELRTLPRVPPELTSNAGCTRFLQNTSFFVVGLATFIVGILLQEANFAFGVALATFR